MLWGDHIDVVASSTLKGEHQPSEDMWGRAFRGRANPLADVVILAEDTSKVAVSEENGPGSLPTPEALFFPHVGE